MIATVLPFLKSCTRCAAAIDYSRWEEAFDCVFCGRRGLCERCVSHCCLARLEALR